ncbi:MAG TPA: DUF1206 domain-containing protein [Gemmatimonadota bacterium]|jgi:hypothetical protein
MLLSSRARTWLERLARLGYASKGVVYLLIAATALTAAVRARGSVSGARGALVSLLDEPFGRTVLLAVGLGLLAYVLWRFLQAVLDCDAKGSDLKGLGVRAFFLVNGIIYLSLALAALDLSRGVTSAAGDDGPERWTAKLMSQPAGRPLVAAAGATLIGVALYQGWRAWTARFRKRLKTGAMSRREETWATRVGRVGLATRAVTFVLIGTFLLRAAEKADPSEAGGLAEALGSIGAGPLGAWLLGGVAVGLASYGLFQLTMARYRRIRIG